MAKHTPKRGFGQILTERSGRFRARYTHDLALHTAPNTFETRQDAEAWLVDERRLISAGIWTSPAARKVAVAELEEQRKGRSFTTYARAWLDGQQHLRPTTRASYTTSLERHLIPAFGATPIDEITTEAIRAWHQSYGTRTPTARAHAYAVLKAILAQAVDDEVIRRNPARVRAASRAAVARDPEVLTIRELLALADAMPEKHRALTLLAGFAGLRFGETAALRRRDVDLDAGTIRVERGMTRAGGIKVVGKPKTKAAVRTVHIPNVVVDALRAHLRTVPITGGRDALVFPGKDGQPLAPTALYGRASRIEQRGGNAYEKAAYGFYAAREAIGRPNLHWHDLRRTAATLGAQSGATVKEMQSRLGHETPSMALHYQGASAERDRAIAEALSKMVESVE